MAVGSVSGLTIPRYLKLRVVAGTSRRYLLLDVLFCKCLTGATVFNLQCYVSFFRGGVGVQTVRKYLFVLWDVSL